ncbi:MAG: PEGA domain-containing protein [Chloroflexota bacterium]
MAYIIIAFSVIDVDAVKNIRELIGQKTTQMFEIDVDPKDAIITLNEKNYDPNESLSPGEYIIKVSKSGYFPYEEKIRIYSNEENHISIKLVPIVNIQTIRENASYPFWDSKGDLYFYDSYNNYISKWEKNEISTISYLSGDVYQIEYISSIMTAIALVSVNPFEQNQLYAIDLKTGQNSLLPVQSWFFTKNQINTKLWGFNNDLIEALEKPIWSLSLGEKPKYYRIENADRAVFGDVILVDPSEKWLTIEKGESLCIWEISTYKRIMCIEKATYPIWIHKSPDELLYTNKDGSLYLVNPTNWNSAPMNIHLSPPFVLTEDNSQIIFWRYNPYEGGSSIWSLDLETGQLELLYEAQFGLGKIEELAISYDKKRIAFVSQDNILYAVILKP